LVSTTFYTHPQSLCESKDIGEGTRIWAFAHVLPGARIGRDCNICDHVFIESDVTVGDNVTVKCGVQLWDGITVEDDVFIGPNVTFTNDKFPRSKQYPPEFARTRLCRGSSIGANATILPGITIGEHAMIGAGSVVTRSVPANTLVLGNPARIVRYINTDLVTDPESCVAESRINTSERKFLYQLPLIKDLRGDLSFAEFENHLPFQPKRYFLIFDVPNNEIRGEHAHKECHQFLICIRGSCQVVCDDGRNRREYLLDSPQKGLHIPPMVWGIQYQYSSDAMLLVFASENYDSADYIRDYSQFLKLLSEHVSSQT
jgi:UDP-2-acetamido-3-amino-2,3-dideoxy-glucuronate N-acetyltransferase